MGWGRTAAELPRRPRTRSCCCAPRAMIENEDVSESLTASYFSRPTHGEYGGLAGFASEAGKRCNGMRRGLCGTHHRGFSERLNPSIAPATDCSLPGAEEEMRGNLWEASNEWPLRRAHAPARAVRPAREIAKRSSRRKRAGIDSAVSVGFPWGRIFRGFKGGAFSAESSSNGQP